MRATESKLEFAMAGIFTLLVAGTLFYVYELFAPLAPPRQLATWATITAIVTVIMAVTPVIFFFRRPDPDAIERYWSPFGKLVAILFDLAVASSVWLLLPYASEPLQLLMVIFYSAAISGQVISTAESIGTNVFAVVAIFGSAALFFLQADGAYAGSLALFLMAFGGLMIVVALVLKQAIRSAIASRIDAEGMAERLADALTEAQNARDARTRFIAAASHDLRQPLQAAMLFFHQMQRHPEAARREEAAEGVRHGFAEANALLERMMEHLRIESGAITVHREAVALNPLFTALGDELRLAATHAAIDLRVLPTKLTVNGDRTLLARILRNLLQNGINHSRGARLRLWARRGDGGRVNLFVADDGIGLGADFSETAFEAYAQGAAAIEGGTGMGLGLSIARELARLMEGDLVTISGNRRGAAFCLSMRAATSVAPSHADASPASESARLDGLPILVIDDDIASATALARSLELVGAVVRTAYNPSEIAALAVGKWRAEVVLTDWHVGDGLTGAAAVAALGPAWSDASVIVMTGDGSNETEGAIAATGWPVIWKPLDIDAVLARLDASRDDQGFNRADHPHA